MISDKINLREEHKRKRRQLDADKKRALDVEIQSKLLMTDEYRACDTVLVYFPTEYEIDTKGIISAAFANKKKVALPVTNDDYSLSFYYINSLKELKQGKFKIMEPADRSRVVTEFDTSICIVPALCCDLSGNRIGYGKGCYDRFLSTYSGKSIALCYNDSIVLSIDTEDTDHAVDVLVSDSFVKYI